MLRAVAAGIAVVLAAATDLTIALVTSRPSAGWWVALGVLVVVGVLLQVAVTYHDKGSRDVGAVGSGSVAVGGQARKIRTLVRRAGVRPGSSRSSPGVSALGAGSVGVGGDAYDVTTDVTGEEDRQEK